MRVNAGFAPARHPGRVVIYKWDDGQLLEVDDLSVAEAGMLIKLIQKVVELIQEVPIFPPAAEGDSP